FQAEDGIRDPLVTGVQTCALPISQVERVEAAAEDAAELAGTGFTRRHQGSVDVVGRVWKAMVRVNAMQDRAEGWRVGAAGQRVRSEERRVGKEGTAGGWRAECRAE